MAYTLWTLIQDMLSTDMRDIPASFDAFTADAPEESSSMVRALNSALADLCSGDFKFKKRYSTVNTVAAQQAYTQPVGKLISIRHSGSTSELTEVDYDTQIWGRDGEGKPSKYGFREGSIQLYPIPDAVYPLVYAYYTNVKAKTTAGVDQQWLVLSTDYPIIPENLKDAIVFGGLMNHYRKINRAKYQHYFKEFKKAKGRYYRELQDSVEGGNLVIDAIEIGWQ